MTATKPMEISKYLKTKKNILILSGSLCDEIDFDGKRLLDYVVEIAHKAEVPVAATGNTILGLKAKDVKRAKKMWAAEVVNYMRYPWQDSIMEQRPELLVFIGYSQMAAQRLVTAVKDAETMVLGNAYVEEATYSLPDSSLSQWQQSLEQIVSKL